MVRQLLEGIEFIHSCGMGHGDISGRNIAFSSKRLSNAIKEYIFEVLGPPETEPLARLDGSQLPKGLPEILVKATEWDDWIDEDEEDLRIFDFGEGFIQGEEPDKIAQPGALRAPETIFTKSVDYRTDLWRSGCVIYSFIFGPIPFQYLGDDDDILVSQMIGLIGSLPKEWQPQ